MNTIRPIAIYLPQFHPVAENNEWWGKGFTEWTNVVKARPIKPNHYQPHLPTDLGFYDLRVSASREDQARMALEHGISGFCYYHYWFNGRRILERPFQEVFESKKPDFPFMLCWANENWTRTWDGANNHILLEQKYSLEDDLAHIKSLIPYFKDPRYIKIDGKPVFAIYRSTLFPTMEATIKIWREEAARQGIELYLCRFESFGCVGNDYLKVGFDAAIEFQPHSYLDRKVSSTSTITPEKHEHLIIKKSKLAFDYYSNLIKNKINPPHFLEGQTANYDDLILHSMHNFHASEGYKRFPCVIPGFDNTPRKKKNFFIIENNSPDQFENWCKDLLQKFKPYSKDENLFFINAWNEWGEGNHLEPCRKWQLGFLEAWAKAFEQVNSQT